MTPDEIRAAARGAGIEGDVIVIADDRSTLLEFQAGTELTLLQLQELAKSLGTDRLSVDAETSYDIPYLTVEVFW